MRNNLGATRLRRRRRRGDLMRAYDALPEPLRRWLADAVLPWSPASCRRIWQKSRAKGECIDTLLARLTQAERQTLMRDRLPGPMAIAETDSI